MRLDDYTKGNVEYHSKLCPLAWQGEKLLPEVRKKLMQIATVFRESLDIPDFETLDIVLTGSMANYNYTDYSDFDIHVVTRYSDLQCDDLAEAFYTAKKKIWNDEHDIKIRGHEAELYVEDVATPPVSGGIYSILDNRWIKKPEYNPPKINDQDVNHKVQDLIMRIQKSIASNDQEEMGNLFNKIKRMRKNGLAATGEFGPENLTFKILRNEGYIEKLVVARRKQQDAELSLDENEIHEVRMSPRTFQTSIQQGTEQGVLVGFEFEVCMYGYMIHDLVKNSDSSIGQIMSMHHVYYNLADRLTPELWDRVFHLIGKSPDSKTASEAFEAKLVKYEKYVDNIKKKIISIEPKLDAAYAREARTHIESAPKTLVKDSKLMARARYALRYYRNLFRHIVGGYTDIVRKSTFDNLDEILNLEVDDRKYFNGLSMLANTFSDPTDIAKLLKLPARFYDNFDDYFYYDAKNVDRILGIDSLIIATRDSSLLAQRLVKDKLSGVYNRPVHVFSTTKQRKKNITDFYIEPDGSLEKSPGDHYGATMEIVSPPVDPNTAMSWLDKFYELADELDLYTNESTGLHINVSIPESIDLLKLALFSGDRYILQMFDRENNEFVHSVLRDLKNAQNPLAPKIKNIAQAEKYLQKIVKSITNAHYASISKEKNKTYISFRHAGNNYLESQQDVKNSVGRFVRAIQIASDPNAYREEYLKKLVQLVGQNNPKIFGSVLTDKQKIVAGIREKGMPVVDFTVYCRSKNKILVLEHLLSQLNHDQNFIFRRDFMRHERLNIISIPDSADSKIKKDYPEYTNFFSYRLIPTSYQDYNSLFFEKISSDTLWRLYYITGVVTAEHKILPLSDPFVQQFIKKLLQNQYL